MSNKKPADELLFIRERIKQLQAREAELKDGIRSGALDNFGDYAIAAISKRKTKRFDRKAAEAELGDLSRFDVEGETIVIRVEELTNPDAA
jgi:hypothetical protein